MVRIKERYLLVNILYPAESPKKANVPDCIIYHQPTSAALTPGALLRAIRSEVTALFGDYGAGSIESGLSVKYLSHATSTFIIRVSRNSHRLVWAALTCMTHVPCKDGKRCVFRVVRVSGTIRKAEEEAILNAKRLHMAATEQSQAPTPFQWAQDDGAGSRQASGALDVEDNDDYMSDAPSP